MPRIMIRRPTRQEAVPTGLTTDIIKLDTLDIPVTMRCPPRRDSQMEAEKRVDRGRKASRIGGTYRWI
jgi:hypothetical protein